MTPSKRNPRGAGRKLDPHALSRVGAKLNMYLDRDLMARLVAIAQQRQIPLAVHVREVLDADARRR